MKRPKSEPSIIYLAYPCDCPHECPCRKGIPAPKFTNSTVILEPQVKGALRSKFCASEPRVSEPVLRRASQHFDLLIVVSGIPDETAAEAESIVSIVDSYLQRTGGAAILTRVIEPTNAAPRLRNSDKLTSISVSVRSDFVDPHREIERFLNRTIHDAGIVGPVAVYDVTPKKLDATR